MLVGVQGCGKSLAAKVIAREWQLPLLQARRGRACTTSTSASPRRNLRRALATADVAGAGRAVDRRDREGPVAGATATPTAALSRRLFGSFLTWLQEKTRRVFVVATANDISSLPAGAAPQGPLRRDLLRRPARCPPSARRSCDIHLRPAQPGSDAVRPRAHRRGGRRLQRCRARAGRHLGVAALAAGAPGAGHALILDELGATVPLSRTRREDIERLRALARDRFVPAR